MSAINTETAFHWVRVPVRSGKELGAHALSLPLLIKSDFFLIAWGSWSLHLETQKSMAMETSAGTFRLVKRILMCWILFSLYWSWNVFFNHETNEWFLMITCNLVGSSYALLSLTGNSGVGLVLLALVVIPSPLLKAFKLLLNIYSPNCIFLDKHVLLAHIDLNCFIHFNGIVTSEMNIAILLLSYFHWRYLLLYTDFYPVLMFYGDLFD